MSEVPAPSGACRAVGGVLVALGLVLGFLLYLQPWVQCTVDDSSAGCPVPEDLVDITLAGWLTAGALAIVGAVLLRHRPRPEAPGPR